MYRSSVPEPRHRAWATSLVIAAAWLVAPGCAPEDTAEVREDYAQAQAADDEPVFCVNPQTCTPDPGPRPQSKEECEAATAGLEFLSIWNFDSGPTERYVPLTPGYVPAEGAEWDYVDTLHSTGLYEYDDETTYIKHPQGWEPASVEMQRCEELTGVYHAVGGPFIAWGGGFGGSLYRLCSASGAGNEFDGVCGDEEDFFSVRDAHNATTQTIWGLNLSEWDGISFWARRGPDGQSGIRIWVADYNTDEEVSYASFVTDESVPRACERVRICGCRNHTQCMKYEGELPVRNPDHVLEPDAVTQAAPGNAWFCHDPEEDNEPLEAGPEWRYITSVTDDGKEERHEWCGPFVCQSTMEAFGVQDTQFADKPCAEFTYRTGLKDAFCYDPATEEPPPTDKQCGDAWMGGVNLTTDWQFYKIPFTSLLQQGWAKEFHELLVDKLTGVRFTYDRGYIDYWIDDVAFYRSVD